jgi:hypothetical protein
MITCVSKPLHIEERASPACFKPAIRRHGNAMFACLLLMLLGLGGIPAWAQTTYSPVVMTAPAFDAIDENHVNLFTGKPQFAIPAVKLGEVSFTPFSYNGEVFQQGGIIDHNYGSVVLCQGVAGNNVSGNFQCATIAGNSIQAVYGEERATFGLSSTGQYLPLLQDGATFVDNGSTCTWTKRDGTQIVYVAFHTTGAPNLCQSNNIASVKHPDGLIATYYYYGAYSTAAYGWSPILSIATNSGYMLKYNYSGTPTFGAETSVVAFNRAFETCNPAAVTCTLVASWPTATLTWATKTISPPCDAFPPSSSCTHWIFTIQDAAQRKHVFELNSIFRVITYQPPEATSPVFYYTLCALLIGGAETNCWGQTTYPLPGGVFQPGPIMWDMVMTVTRNGQAWQYGLVLSAGGGLPAPSPWLHSVLSPLGKIMTARGNAAPGTEIYNGPIDSVTHFDGTVDQYERTARNVIVSTTTPLGVQSTYIFDPTRSNLTKITIHPISGSSLPPIVQSATYPEVGVYPCANVVTCNKPLSVIDGNSNEVDFTYDPVHGGMLTEMDPAVQVNRAGALIRPQTTRTYMQQSAWYLNSSGVMSSDANQVWLPATESHCLTSATTSSGTCTGANDQVVTTYSYGPNSGPNNLLLRGKAVSANGQTLRSCYGHDSQGNKIWETSPNANPASCPDY